jgi:hypothetical protein
VSGALPIVLLSISDRSTHGFADIFTVGRPVGRTHDRSDGGAQWCTNDRNTNVDAHRCTNRQPNDCTDGQPDLCTINRTVSLSNACANRLADGCSNVDTDGHSYGCVRGSA